MVICHVKADKLLDLKLAKRKWNAYGDYTWSKVLLIPEKEWDMHWYIIVHNDDKHDRTSYPTYPYLTRRREFRGDVEAIKELIETVILKRKKSEN